MSTVTIRYIVHDVDAAIDFYTSYLQFELKMPVGRDRSGER
jgi:catechol 2,3-dioxygenase-like lactoylglutathione lyase family enzyme